MTIRALIGNCREVLPTLPAEAFDCIVTSPPYWGLRDYGVDGQIGLEPTLDGYVEAIAGVARELWRVLKPSGTFWLNLGDCYAGSWGAQSRGGAPSASSTLRGNGHFGGGPKLKSLSAVQIAAHPQGVVGTGSVKTRMPGLKPKDQCLIPERVALRLQADGWWVRKRIIWAKPNPMPESVTDRPTSAHEHVWFLTKAERYFYDADAIREAESVPDWDNGSRVFGGVNKHGANAAHGDRTTGRITGPRKRGIPPRHSAYASSDQSGLDFVGRGGGRNARDVWMIASQPYSGAHFATMPPALAERCILAGCPVGGHVLDPFGGAGTTGLVADRLGRNATLIELNPAYIELQRDRIEGDGPLFADVTVGEATQ